jgi:ATP/maltotriose-dependent transcriptional regulator MalT
MRQGDMYLHPVVGTVRSSNSLFLVLGTSPSRGAMATRADPSRGAAAFRSQALFVGRQPMLARLCRMLEQARAGQPRLVLLEGPAGIGKTSLVRRFLAEAAERCVLRASGEEAEAGLPLGVLAQLLAAAPTTPPGTAAVEVAGERPVDPLAAGAVLLDLLGALQRTNPVVVVVDDLHWADPPSLRALTFALRRLRVDRVLTLVLTREVAEARLPEGLRRLLADDDTQHLRLGGLEAEEVRTLSGQLGHRPLSVRAAARLRAHTDGSPLHARALLEQVPAAALDDPQVPLPAPRSFALLVLARLAACGADVQELVAAASVLGARCGLHQAAALAKLDDPLPALEHAIAAGLLVEQPGGLSVGFPHPLVHAAIYQQLGPARRAELHTRAAGLADDEPARLRHRVRAAGGPDPALAADLARGGRRHTAAGAWASAAEQLSAAARLAPGRADREQFTLEAVECQLLAGELGDPAGVAARLQGFRDGGWRSYVLGRLAFVGGRLDEAEALLDDGWRRCDPATDPTLAARVAGQLAAVNMTHLRGAETADWANLALRLAPEQTTTDLIRLLPLNGLGVSGHADSALASVANLPDPAVASLAELDALLGRGMLRIWTDDLVGARRDLAGVLAAGQGRSMAFRVVAAVTLGEAEYRLGRWDDAMVHCELALSIATDADLTYLAPYCHTIAVLVSAARGDWDDAEHHAKAAQAGATRKDLSMVIYAGLTQAHLARARGQPEAVIAALDPLLRWPDHDGVDEPGVTCWRDLLADALVTVGDLDQADLVLGPFEAMAVARQRHSAIAAAARARANLEAARGDHARCDQAFQAGLAHATQVDLPFDHALLQLAYGGFLRRAGKRTLAAAQLRDARDTLARLDARPDLERCERELAACGLRPGRRKERDTARLTPQELAVARLVAAGLSNQQAARELVVSVKTVEYHLGNVYAKLQVTSRGQLSKRLAKA